MAKKRIRVKPKAPVKFILAAALLIYFSVTFVQQQIKIEALKANAETIQTEISVENEKTAEIKENMKEDKYLSRVEDIARDKLGYLKENEVLFIDSSLK